MKTFLLSLVVLSAAIFQPLNAAPNSPIGSSDLGLSGTVQTDYWDEMSRQKLNIPQGTSVFGQLDPNGPQDPYHPAAKMLPYILAQNRLGGARLHRTNGSGNVAEKGLYDVGGMGLGLDLAPDDPVIAHLMAGTVTREYLASRPDITPATFTDPFQLRIESLDVVEGLETVVFQIHLFGMKINPGYVTPFEMTEMLFPVQLSINGGAMTLLPDFRELLIGGDYSGGGSVGGDEAQGTELWAFQWNLSGLEMEIESFTIDFAVYPHSSTRGLRIDQSDLYRQVVAVPEPGTWATLITGLGALVLYRRKLKLS